MDKLWRLAFFEMDDDNVHMIDDSYLLKVAKNLRPIFFPPHPPVHADSAV